MLAVGDPRRAQLRRALTWTLVVAGVFSLTTGPIKQYAPWYDHAPWVNDPYDTVISFAMFFVPLVAVICVTRMPLCRRNLPASVSRFRDLLRGCYVIVVALELTLATQWIAVASGANHHDWNATTTAQISLLLALSIATFVAAFLLLSPTLRSLLRASSDNSSPDWLSDVVAVAATIARGHSGLASRYLTVLEWIDVNFIARVRRHPLWSTWMLWMAFATAVATMQSLSEGYQFALTVLFVVLLGGGMFALSVVAGSFIGVVRAPRRLSGRPRRLLDSVIATMIGILVVFALRLHQWWLVASSNSVAGLRELVVLLALCGAAIFCGTWAVESALTIHGTRD